MTLVEKLTPIVCFNNLLFIKLNPESTQHKIQLRVSALIPVQLPNESKINSVNYLTHSVFFIHSQITQWTQNKLSERANI